MAFNIVYSYQAAVDLDEICNIVNVVRIVYGRRNLPSVINQ